MEIGVVIINGQEYKGESLRYVKNGGHEYFTWLIYDENGISVSSYMIR